MKLVRYLSLALLIAPIWAGEKNLLNLDKTGLALQGYDPVAFFVENKPIKGRPELRTYYQGAAYYFANLQDKKLFEAEPQKYAPAFGGYCAFGVSRNKLVEVDVNAFQVVNGRLLLQYSKGVQNDFNKNAMENLQKADRYWPVLLEKKGK